MNNLNKLIPELNLRECFLEIEKASRKADEELKDAQEEYDRVIESNQLGEERETCVNSLIEVTLESRQCDEKLKKLEEHEEVLKKEILDYDKKIQDLKKEHEEMQEKLKEVDFDPMFYKEKIENLQEEIREVTSCQEYCNVHNQKREQSHVQETAQPSALDILRRERARKFSLL